MGLWEIFMALILVFLSIGKPIVYRPIAKKYNKGFSSTIMALWLMLGIILSVPFQWAGINNYIHTLNENRFAIFLSMLKGILIFYSIEYAQLVNKESTSSYMFSRFISLAITAFILNIFFNEHISSISLISIIGLGFLGFIFCYFGDISRLSVKYKKYFITAILIAASAPVVDYLCIKRIGWYPYFVISNLFLLLFIIIRGISWHDIKLTFTVKDARLAGFFIAFYEFAIIRSSIDILPISLISFFTRLAVPIVMIFSAVRYKESTIKKQLFFGIIALIIALPIILKK